MYLLYCILFIWLHWVLVSACEIFLSLLQNMESLVAAHGIQFPDQGLSPGPLHWECRVLATGPPARSHLHPLLHATRWESPRSWLRWCNPSLLKRYRVWCSEKNSGVMERAPRLEGEGMCLFVFNCLFVSGYAGLRCCRDFSLVAESGAQCAGFSLRWPLCLRSTGSGLTGFSSCRLHVL